MNESVNQGLEGLRDNLLSTLETIIAGIPAFVGAILVFVLGIFVAWVGALFVRKMLGWIKIGKLAEKTPFRRIARSLGYGKGIEELLSRLVYWALLLVFLATASNIIGLTEVAAVIGNIFSYIPRIAAALIIVILGAYIARILRETVYTLLSGTRVPYTRGIADAARILVYIFVIIFALDQLGLDTYILISNLNIVLAGFALAFAVAFGFGFRSAAGNMVAVHYLKKMIRPKDRIRSGELEGRVQRIGRVGVFLEDKEGNRRFIEGRKLMENLEIIRERERK